MLDVKVGQAAFMKTLDEAKVLARAMADVGKGLGVKTSAVLTEVSPRACRGPCGHIQCPACIVLIFLLNISSSCCSLSSTHLPSTFVSMPNPS